MWDPILSGAESVILFTLDLIGLDELSQFPDGACANDMIHLMRIIVSSFLVNAYKHKELLDDSMPGLEVLHYIPSFLVGADFFVAPVADQSTTIQFPQGSSYARSLDSHPLCYL